MPAFSHDGENLAYGCFRSDDEAALYSLPLPDGKPKMIVPFLVDPNGLTWSADDKRLIYSRWKGRGSDELGEVTVANGSVKRLALEGSALRPTVSPKADKLAYSSLSVSSTIWRRDLLHSESPGVELSSLPRGHSTTLNILRTESVLLLPLCAPACRESGSAMTMAATWCRSQTPIM